MHEFGIAEALLNTALETARRAEASKVEQVNLRIGALAGVVDEALVFAFDALAEDTPAHGARLVIEPIAVTCYCEPCATAFEPPRGTYRCPTCQTLSRSIKTGRELQLISIEVS